MIHSLETFQEKLQRQVLILDRLKKKVIELLKTCFESTNVIQEFNDCYNVVQSL